jgi:hypothetical protein
MKKSLSISSASTHKKLARILLDRCVLGSPKRKTINQRGISMPDFLVLTEAGLAAAITAGIVYLLLGLPWRSPDPTRLESALVFTPVAECWGFGPAGRRRMIAIA